MVADGGLRTVSACWQFAAQLVRYVATCDWYSACGKVAPIRSARLLQHELHVMRVLVDDGQSFGVCGVEPAGNACGGVAPAKFAWPRQSFVTHDRASGDPSEGSPLALAVSVKQQTPPVAAVPAFAWGSYAQKFPLVGLGFGPQLIVCPE